MAAVGWGNYEAFLPQPPSATSDCSLDYKNPEAAGCKWSTIKASDGSTYRIQAPVAYTQADLADIAQEHANARKAARAAAGAMTFLPPLALLIAGFVIRWIIRGFRPVNPTL